MSWLISRALGEAFESSLLSQAQGAAFSGGSSWGGAQSAQLNVIFTQHPFWLRDKMITTLDPSPFGATFAASTEEDGEVLLTWYREVFLAKTSAPLGVAQVSPVRAVDYGRRWRELSTRFVPSIPGNLSSPSWKTRPSLWDEGLTSSLPTLPRWGSMRNGALLERVTLVRRIDETGSGFLPTPVKYDSTDWGQKEGNNYHGLGWQAANVWGKTGLVPTPNRWDMKAWDGQNQENLTNRVMVNEGHWPTPTANMKKQTMVGEGAYGSGTLTLMGAVKARQTWDTPCKGDAHPRAFNRTRVYDGPGQEHLQSQAMRLLPLDSDLSGLKLNPTWVEWLMGWPMSWTALQPLETGKFQQWLSLHGITSQTE